jgi:hypothetical protein
MNILASYINGDFSTTLYDDGTKVRQQMGPDGQVSFPESIDVKITDYCDAGCSFCHEVSTKWGEHGDLDKLFDVLSVLPKGIEIAIGGGNPLDHSELEYFLVRMKDAGFICNLTVNQQHVPVFRNDLVRFILQDLVKGIGISVSSQRLDDCKFLYEYTSNIVWHVIAGVHNHGIMESFYNVKNYGNTQLDSVKILILGYKDFGLGTQYRTEKVDQKILWWRRKLPKLLRNAKYHGYEFSFDNLAVEQLKLQNLFTAKAWSELYMGDDFEFSMYIDAAKQEFAETSRSVDRVSWSNNNLLNYFRGTK